MGIMMLHLKQRLALLPGVVGRQVVRMSIGCQIGRGMFIKPGQAVNCLPESILGCFSFQVTDMLTDECLLPDRRRDGVFEVRPHRQGRGESVRQHYRQGRIAPGAAQQQLPAGHQSHDRIVDMAADWAVVHQEQLGNTLQPPQRVLFIDADRLVGNVAAGGHHRPAQRLQQQVMERSVW